MSHDDRQSGGWINLERKRKSWNAIALQDFQAGGTHRPQSWPSGPQLALACEPERDLPPEGEESADSYSQDPQHPYNWTRRTKWCIVGALTWISFVTPLAFSLIAPVAPQVKKDLHITSSIIATFTVSAYTLGSAVGPIIFAPLSEVYGRLPVYHLSNTFFLIFSLACSVVKTGPQLIAMRFLESCLGTASLTMAAATIADLFAPESRASAMMGSTLGPLLGPAVGPVVGGVISQHLNWRWIFRILGIAAAFNAVLCALLLQETYWPLIQRRRKRLGGDYDKESRLRFYNKEFWTFPKQESLGRSMLRPLRLLVLSPVVTIICLYGAIVFGIMYMLFVTIGFVFSQYYGFSEQQSGFVYIALGVGMIFGLFFAAKASDGIASRIKTSNDSDGSEGRQIEAEDRVPFWITLVGSATFAGGLLLYGWIIQNRIHWSGAVAGLFLVGWGVLFLVVPVQQYLIEAFPDFASSTMGSNAFLRALTTGLLPLSGLGLYDKLGMGWGHTLLAGILTLSIILPEVCRRCGARLRERFPV